MRKKTTSLFLIGFFLVLKSALASYTSKPTMAPVLFPSPEIEHGATWQESPFGIFAYGMADCDNDTEDPTVAVKNITVNLDSGGTATIVADDIDNGSSDNCQINNMTLSQTSFSCTDVGQQTVRLTVTDASNNSAYKNATVTVKDEIKPVVRIQNITVQLDSSGNVSISPEDIDNGSLDNCGIKKLTLDKNQFDCDDIGSNTVSLTVTDNSDNSESKTATITVEDKTNPVAIAKDITIQLDEKGNATIAEDAVNNGSTDACGGLTFDTNITSFDCSNIGENEVTLTVTDAKGNKSTANATITVEDKMNPVAKAKDITIQLDENGNAAIAEDAVNNGSTDACGGLTFDTNITSFDCSNVGENEVTLIVTDAKGNKATTTATVTVQDQVDPIARATNVTIYLDENATASITPEEVDDGSTDNCGIASLNLSKTNFDCSNTGDNKVTLTVTDVNGNSATATAVIEVIDNIKPEIPTLEDLTWSCAEEITNYPTTNDNCESEITGTTTDNLEFDSFGEFTITWTFTDSSNNSVTAEQKIIIPEPTVDLPGINGSAFCNAEEIPAITFTGNSLENNTYSWSYSTSSTNNADIGLSKSGTGNIPSFNAKNITNEPVTATFTVTPFGNGCEGDPVEFSIIINPTPTITKPADIVLCDGEVIPEIKFPGVSVSGSRRDWVNDNTSIGLHESGRGNIPAFTATNNTTESIFANIIVTPTANNCEGIAETFRIEVKPNPTVTAPEDQVYCNGVATETITLSGSPSGVKYDITGGGDIGLANKSGVSQIPSFIPINNTTSPISATITLTPKATECIGEPVIYTVTINPTPNVSISPSNQQLCSGEITSLSLSGSTQGSAFSWTVSEITPPGSITGAEDGNGNKIEQALTNNTNNPATVKYRVTPTANECSGTPISVTVTVNPTPVLEITNPDTVCSPAAVDLTSEEIIEGSSAGLTFTYWTNEGATSSLNNPTEAGPGTYYIKATSGSGCSIVKPVVVTENPTPQLTSPLQATGFCSETAFVYEFSSNVPGTTFSWNRKAINGISTPANRGEGNIGEVLVNDTNNPIEVTYEITLVSPDGCPNIQEVTTTVTPTPTLTSTLSPPAVCSETPFEYTPKSQTSGTVFKWSRAAVSGISNSAASGTGPINETLENTTTQPLTVKYIYSLSSNNCENPDTYTVAVTIIPAPDTEVMVSKRGEQPVESEIEVCPGESVDLFSSTSLVENLPPVLLASDFNNGSQNWTLQSSSNNTNWSLTNNGTRAYGGTYCYYRFENWRWRLICEDRAVNFHSNDNSQFFLISSYGNNRNYNNVSLVSPSFSTEGYTSLELTFWHHYKDGGGTWHEAEDVGKVEYSVNGGAWRHLETYTSTQGEEDDFRKVTLTGLPVSEEDVRIRFNYDDAYNDNYWAIDNVRITGEGSGSPEVEWTSDIGDFTSTEPNPKNVTPSETTVYTATYMDPVTKCPGSASVKVIVRKPPKVTISANYCGDSRYIELISDKEYQSYYWESAGKEFGRDRTLNVEVAQTYILTVTDEYGCTGTGSINISEELVINGDFENGARDFDTDYRNKTGTGDLYPEGDFAVDDNARDYHSNFYGRDHTTGSGNFLIVNGSPKQNQVIWKQTIDNIQPNTNYYFSAWGMNINPASPAQLQFRVNGELTGTVAYLDNADKPTSNNQVSRENWIQFYSNPFWNSGDNTSVTLEIVNINVTQGGNDFGLDDISFGTLEPIIFSIDPTNNSVLCSGDTLELYANIEGGREPIEYTWTNGEGEVVSTEENPVLENITAEDAGTYTLSVTDAYGCDPTVGTTEVVIIPETVVDAGEDMVICAEDAEIQLNGVISGSVTTGIWSGGNGSFNPNSAALNAVYTPTPEEINAGSVLLTLTSDEPDAPCVPVEDTVTISINPTPVIDSVEISSPLCYSGADGSATVKVSSGTAPYTYLWSDGQTGETALGLLKIEEEDHFYVTVTDANGCSVTSEAIIIEEPTPLEIASTGFTEPTCFGNADGTATIEVSGGFLAGNTPNYNYQLLDSDGNTVFSETNSEENSLTVTELPAGSYTFLVSSGESCAAFTRNLTIIQPPEIIADAGGIIMPEECGTKVVGIEAVQIDPETGAGEWTYISPDGGTGSFADPFSYATSFFGEAGKNYELTWTVTPVTDCPAVPSEPLIVEFPPECSKLNFDGEDDYVYLGNNHNLRNPNNSFTIEVWAKPHSLTGVNTIISKRNAGDLTEGGYDLILNAGRPALRINNKTISINETISTNRWYHIAVTHSGNEVSIYVDGIRLKTENVTNKPQNIPHPTLIGAMYNPATPNNPDNYFHGWIEEVRLWDKALSQDQLQFIMNQRVVKNGSSGIRGEILPLDIPGSLSWNDLLGYYRLLTSEVQDGITTDLGSKAIHGELRNIQDNQQNSAPLPYETSGDGDWWNTDDSVTAWKYGYGTWDAPNSLGINRDPIEWNIVKLSNNLTSEKDITVLGLISEKGAFTFAEKANSNGVANFGNMLRVTHYLKLNGSIDLVGESQLVQDEGSILDETSTGFIEIDQQGTASSYNYNYWSSPVLKNRHSKKYKVEEVMFDGTPTVTGPTRDANPEPLKINFGNGAFFADGDYSSPVKVSSYWIYAFRKKPVNEYSAWEHVGSAKDSLLPGEGFTMKGTSGKANIPDRQHYTFKGLPNNGDITLSGVQPGQQYLIGNPYPSAINIEQFIKENIKNGDGSNSQNVFNGAVYFYDHFSGKTHYVQEYIGGYATRNLIGGVPAVSLNKNENANDGKKTKRPGAYISVGQGFIINTNLDENLAGSFSGIEGGTITFKNSHRSFQPENPGASQYFLRPESKEKTVAQENNRSEIRFDFESPLGYHRQILLGTDPDATNDFDLGFDALSMDNNKEDMYWFFKDHEFIIQGVSNINEDQVLPLSIKIAGEGEFSIKIAELENVPDETKIYLRDNIDTTYYNLRKEGFTTTVEPGLYTDRFEVVFTDGKVIEDNRPKIWLSFESDAGNSREIVAIQDAESTNNYDSGKDKSLSENLSEDMYWLIEDSEFVIQEVPEFGEDQEFPLGVKINSREKFNIGIARLENIPDGMEIFLKDSKNKLFHNLRKSGYQTSAEPGTVNDRFTLVFKETKIEDEEIPSGNLEVIYVHDTREIIVRNPELIKISKIYLNNILGQQVHVYYNVPHKQEILLPVNRFSSGVYIIKLLSEEETVTKKIILE